jgi:hypothetical protein
MKLAEHFDTFLVDVINLNQTRIDKLKARVDTIVEVVKCFDVYEDILIDMRPQGSWAHRTIIKPAGIAGSFDADVVAFVKPHDEWTPADYIDHLYDQFKAHGTYADKVSRKTRCVTIQYAGEFSIDVVPCIRRANTWETTEWILNRKDDVEEQVNPDGYTDWFLKQNRYVGNNQLIKTVRILKYLRDFKLTFLVKSILLTTLIGERISFLDEQGDAFSDTPTALRTVIKRLDAYLQQHPEIPEVVNPKQPSESFTRHWNQDKYSNFRTSINRYAEWVEDAYVETDRDKSIVKWRRIFGDDFAKSVIISKAVNLIDNQIDDVSHVARPPWPILLAGRIEITATLHSSKEGNFLGTYRSDGSALSPDTWLHFTANHSFTNGIAIKWQIVNTGWSARVAKCLRGGFDRSGSEIWEHTLYRGKHWVECFAVDLKRGVSLGRSGRFYVNVV